MTTREPGRPLALLVSARPASLATVELHHHPGHDPGEDRPPDYVRSAVAPLRQLNLDATGNLTTFYAGLSVDTLPTQYGDDAGFGLRNIMHGELADMLHGEKMRRMVNDFARSHDHCAADCAYYDVCTGG